MAQTDPSSPWSRHSNWKQGFSSPEEESVGYHWFFAIAWIVAVQFLGPAGFWKQPFDFEGHFSAWMTHWLLQIGGAVLIVWAVRSQLSKKRFGATILRLDTLPGVPGNDFRGTVLIPRLPANPPPAVITASCVQTAHGSQNGSRAKILWKHQGTAMMTKNESNLWQALIEVHLPQEHPDTRNAAATGGSGSHSIRWQIEVKIPLPGPDFKRTYVIPVYRR